MNVRPGSLAVVVSGGLQVLTPGILSRIVEVVRPAYNGEKFLSTTGELVRCADNGFPCWVVTSRTPLPWMMATGPNKGKTLLFAQRAIRDACLREINDPGMTDEVLKEQEQIV